MVHVAAALLAFVVAIVLPASASAQGRCSCNNGCHQYPGQCVQPGSSACEAGFAPFCATRAGTCPTSGWVSCGGECTCVRITPVDAGVRDAGSTDVSTPMDVPVSIDVGVRVDVPVSTDVPASMDTGVRLDVPASMDLGAPSDVLVSVDVRPGTDAPAATDALVSVDVRPPADAPPTTDVPIPTSDAGVPVSDSPTTPPDSPEVLFDGGFPFADVPALGDVPAGSDAGCECVGGACIEGVCYRERCVYNPELGFICGAAGTACRLVGGEPICVPICVGVVCAAGQFCDERSNGLCVADRCATIQCPVGTTCLRNQCGRWGDGGTASTDDSGVFSTDDSGVGGPPTATDDGCGCRVGQTGGRGARWAFPAALLALFGLSVRRRRAARATPGQRSRSTT